MPDYAVVFDGVSKRFGSVWALRGLDLRVRWGSIYGLLGPNGSGKSTAMRIMLGVVEPDEGRVVVGGVDVVEDPIRVRRMAGYVPETPHLYDYLTGLEYLDFIGEVYGVPPRVRRERVEEFLKAFELKGRENELIQGYSRGMRQKIALIAALLHRPRILILDEPLSGLDPKSARLVKDLLNRLKDEGVAIILSTHILEIADALCDEVAIMYGGRKIAEGRPGELREEAGMPGSTLEEVFLKLTGGEDLRSVIEALTK